MVANINKQIQSKIKCRVLSAGEIKSIYKNKYSITTVYIVKKAGAGGRNRVSLVTSKTRVAPVKKISSTPRLELLAALIVAR